MTKPQRESVTSGSLAELFDLVGRRWTLRILWELRGRTLSFNDLRRAVGGMSQSVLVTRLTELFGAGLVADVPGGYELTGAGTSLAQALESLDGWAAGWTPDHDGVEAPPDGTQPAGPAAADSIATDPTATDPMASRPAAPDPAALGSEGPRAS